jgi:uncharacterized UBP type Zn finger protein
MPTTLHRRNDRGRLRPCGHLAATRSVEPHSAGCQECLDRGDCWANLCLCLSCGWVACSDDSPNHHAKDHYEETDHPIAATPPRNPNIRWCYVHQRTV